jgi:hypothetical protein
MVEVSTIGFLSQEASLLVQSAVEALHNRFYCYDSESSDNDKVIYSSGGVVVRWATITSKEGRMSVGPALEMVLDRLLALLTWHEHVVRYGGSMRGVRLYVVVRWSV